MTVRPSHTYVGVLLTTNRRTKITTTLARHALLFHNAHIGREYITRRMFAASCPKTFALRNNFSLTVIERDVALVSYAQFAHFVACKLQGHCVQTFFSSWERLPLVIQHNGSKDSSDVHCSSIRC